MGVPFVKRNTLKKQKHCSLLLLPKKIAYSCQNGPAYCLRQRFARPISGGGRSSEHDKSVQVSPLVAGYNEISTISRPAASHSNN